MIDDGYIKREAALEAIDRIRLEVWLIDIPSPTVPEYIEHHEGIQHVLGEIDALRKKMERLPGIDEQKPGKWIPCKERLPENNVEVLVSTTWGSIEIAWLSKGTWVTEEFYFDEDRLPIAWMPLPVPYKGEHDG